MNIGYMHLPITNGRVLGALGAMLVVWATLSWLVVDERDEIRSVLDSLASAGSFEGNVHPIEQLGYAKSIASFFASDVKLHVLDDEGLRPAINGRKDLEEKLLVVRRMLEQLAVKTSSIGISLKGGVAEVTCEGRAMGREPGRADYFLEQHDLKARLEKIDGKWLITSGQNVNPIESASHE
jgi:hypothetical protein